MLPLVSAAVSVPQYDRADLTPGIVHIGLGNFHRAHQAWYLHRLMQNGTAQDWAIIGAGVRSYDAHMREKLKSQDFLTTLIELDPSGSSAEIIGSMIDYLPVEHGNASLIRQMSHPETRIVSLTVTEGGYCLDSVSGKFDASHPDIRHDIGNPDNPNTAFGAIVAALKIRRQSGIGPFTLLSCDNLRGNGVILRQCVVSLARCSDPGLANWIDEECSFPNSMVDCIVPTTSAQEIGLAASYGIQDAAPVSHENYRQWIIEDQFCAGRPPLEDVGVVFTDDVHKYEAMKIRILNAGHQVIANVGEILGIDSIANCMADPLVLSFFRKVQLEEIAPGVEPLPLIEPGDYVGLVERRFSNPAIIDTTRRVAFDGSSRHTGFVLPVIRDGLDAKRSIKGLALVEALWARMCAGIRENGSLIEPNDPDWDRLNAAALAAREYPMIWLQQEEIYGDLAAQPEFSRAFARWLVLIWSQDCRVALQSYLYET
ncbi:MAG: mannitol dehydrogenase family protein [Pseudomonadota bacterium]